MGLTLVTPPASYPISLADAKAQCRVDGTADDALLTILISSACEYLSAYLSRSLSEQTWKLTLDAFRDEMLLPMGPVTSVGSVKYADPAGDIQTLSTGYNIDLASDPQRVVLATTSAWPAISAEINAVEITFTAGYSSLPVPIKHAALMLISQWFDSSTAISAGARVAGEGGVIPELPHAVTALLANYRSFAF